MPLLFKKKILFLPLLFTLLASCSKEDDPILSNGREEFEILDSVNRLRLAGCTCGSDIMPPAAPLVWNAALAKAAETHAKDMYSRNYFEHISPNGSFPIQRAEAAGYQGSTVLENIAKGYSSAAAVMTAWKASESHCKAMMDSASAEMGSYSYNGFWVQEFGR